MEQLVNQLMEYAKMKGGIFFMKFYGNSGIYTVNFQCQPDGFKVKFTGRDLTHNLTATIEKVQNRYNLS